MASQGKKGKKSKGRTLNLTDFLAENGAKTAADDGATTVVVASAKSWAEEMDDFDEPTSYRQEQIVLPTAPRATRGPDISDDRIPRDPPFTAYVANLPYDIEEEDIMDFFSKLKIKGVRLPRDGDPSTGRLKGFGYADFEDRESLIDALAMNDQTLNNRKIRVDLATQAGKDRGNMGDRRDRGGRYGNSDGGDDRTAGDWRSGPPPPPRDDGRDYDRRGGYDRDGGRGYGSRGRYGDNQGGYGRDRDRDNRGYGFDRRGGGGGPDREERHDDFDRSQMRQSSDRDRGGDRGGFGGDRYGDRDRYGGDRYGGDRYGGDRDRGYGGDRYGGDRGGDRYGDRGGDRYGDRRGGGGRYERRGSPAGEQDGPRERPKLNLAKRSVPVEAASSGPAPSSIFGGAKPVDTARKELEIEDRLRKKEEHPPEEKPKAKSIFGDARPVDTATKEKEIEERLKKLEIEGGEKGEKDTEESEKRPDSRGSGGNRRDPRPRDDRRDNRQTQRDKPKPPRKERSPPPPKKLEDKKAPNFAGSNRFSFLEAEDEGAAPDSD